MSKKIYLFSLVLLALSFVSCEETKEEGRYDNWRARNEAFIDSLENVYATVPGRGDLERFSLFVSPGEFMYYKKKTPVETNQLNTEMVGRRPTSASTVTVYYKGMNILGERFDGFYGQNPSVDAPGGDVNVNEGETNPSSFALSNVVMGWQEALQHMKVGERWLIYVPWDLGYGDKGNSGVVLGYSTLIFDVQLLNTTYPAEESKE